MKASELTDGQVFLRRGSRYLFREHVAEMGAVAAQCAGWPYPVHIPNTNEVEVVGKVSVDADGGIVKVEYCE